MSYKYWSPIFRCSLLAYFKSKPLLENCSALFIILLVYISDPRSIVVVSSVYSVLSNFEKPLSFFHSQLFLPALAKCLFRIEACPQFLEFTIVYYKLNLTSVCYNSNPTKLHVTEYSCIVLIFHILV